MQAVEVDGQYYWDGMYSGKPAIYPLVYECKSRDILLVHIAPAERPGLPTERAHQYGRGLVRHARAFDRQALQSHT